MVMVAGVAFFARGLWSPTPAAAAVDPVDPVDYERLGQAVAQAVPTQDTVAIAKAVQAALATPTPKPTATMSVAAQVEATVAALQNPAAIMPTGTVTTEVPVAIATATQGDWDISFFEGATDQMEGWFSRLKDPNPGLWPRFPNVDNPSANFKAANGLEYGIDESVFMEQNEMGRFPVQARGYRLITGDYKIPGVDACEAESAGAGCAIAIFNVGEVTADLEGWVRQGFTVPGRYWNGDTLEVAMWALSSHVSANMLNMSTFGTGTDTLNNPIRTNAGANCSVPGGCDQVRFVIAITSGNQLLVKGHTVVYPSLTPTPTPRG